jgi:signal peptidase II
MSHSSLFRYHVLLVMFTVGATIGCDRITKTLATSTLKGEGRRSFLKDTVRLEYMENRGAFLGLGRDLSSSQRFWVLTAGTALLLALLPVFALRTPHPGKADLLAWSLFWAGGVSNLLDRALAEGRVVDFLSLGLGPLRTGVFNLADLAITTAAVILLSRHVGDQRREAVSKDGR